MLVQIAVSGTSFAAIVLNPETINGNASNIGVSVGTGFTNPLVVTFPVPIANFFLDVLNGNTIPVTYDLSDNVGNSASFDLVPNLNGGLKTIGFAAAGTMLYVSSHAQMPQS
jgi:hypothetical protein